MPTNSRSPICGIDLGTTNSCIALIHGGEPKVLSIDGRLTMPSVVAYRDGEWLVGEAARNHLWVAPHEAVASIKRKMDNPHYRVMLGNEEFSPIDISAKILQALVQAAEKESQCQLQKVVITVPAWFQEAQRQATLAAGRQAGLEVLQIINEPTAAAIAHQHIPIAEGEEEKWLVYDLGGGTFDVSVLNVTSAAYEVLASQGNTYLGGDDFDHRLAEHFVAHIRNQHNVDPLADKVLQARLHLLAEQTKMRLSSETMVHLEEPIGMGTDTFLLDLTLTREEFEQMIDDLVSSTVEKALQALAEAGIAPSSLTRLLLVGGSTRIPLIAERLVQRFGLEPETWLDPDLSVAIGASVRGAITQGEVFERSVVDICPHTLGIAAMGEEDLEVGSEFFDSSNAHPLTFAPLIRRNSRLPAHFVRTFYKSFDKQQSAQIAVYQGESSNTRQNAFIGEFTVDLQNQHDSKLDVSFGYDLNGTINISVKEAGNQQGRVYTMDLSRSPDANSELGGFSEHVLTHEEASAVEHSPAVTNYLIEKVSQRLEADGTKVLAGMHDQLQRYKTLLEQDDDEALDEVEDLLYEWLESE
ncbi:MAG: molecular chaperone DnaK [Lentisphaeria bacterium]|jgi:molecular chaperone DnaK